ncbi:MAG: hypothetical protein ABH873_03440 [Candidatus Firestonebacteria bacterium]
MKYSIHKKLFLTIEELFKIKPWELLDNDDIFGLSLEGEIYFVSVMGGGGMEYGVFLIKGWEGYKTFTDMLNREMDDDTLMNRAHILSVNLSRKKDVPPEFINYYKRYINNNFFINPIFMVMVKESLKVARLPQDNEAIILYLCIKTIITLFNQNLLDPKTLKEDNKIKVFEITEEGSNINIISKYENIVSLKTESDALEVDEKTLNQIKALPRLQTIYNMSAPMGIMSIKDKIPRVFFIHDDVKDIILVSQVFYEKDLKKGAFNLLKDVFLGKNFLQQKGLPQEIRTDSRYLYENFKQILGCLGLEIICASSIPKIKGIVEEMIQFFSKTKPD